MLAVLGTGAADSLPAAAAPGRPSSSTTATGADGAGVEWTTAGRRDPPLAPALQRLPAAPLLGASERPPTALFQPDGQAGGHGSAWPDSPAGGGAAPAVDTAAVAAHRTAAPVQRVAAVPGVQRATGAGPVSTAGAPPRSRSAGLPSLALPAPAPADAGAIAVAAGLADRDPDGTVVFRQAVADPAPIPEPSTVDSAPVAAVQRLDPAGAPAAVPAPAGGEDVDELVRRLYEPLSARIKAELRLDRERAGMLTDLRR
jgi:hypothetical protein